MRLTRYSNLLTSRARRAIPAALLCLLGALPAAARVANGSDFNGDGFQDLAIAVQNESVNGVVAAGAVHVLYGSASGVTTTGAQFWHQDSPGVADAAEPYDVFGSVIGRGDFNGDGFDDLALAAPWEDIGDATDAGALHILYGSVSGLTTVNAQYFTQSSAGVPDFPETDDTFGISLYTGAADFDGDGDDDLAVGVPGENVAGIPGAGAVHIFQGGASGLTPFGGQYWHQNMAGIPDACEQGDSFGLNGFATGDFNGDDFADLAIGVPLEDLAGWSDVGAVHILYGSAGGLVASGSQFWNQAVSGVANDPDANDVFGRWRAAGDFNGDGFDDLAIGVPGEEMFARSGAGAVQILYGSVNRLTTTGARFLHQDSAGIADTAEDADGFGQRVEAADFNGDGFSDLVIGVSREDIGGLTDAGAVHVLFGAASGLSGVGSQFWSQDSAGVVDFAEAGDLFGNRFSSSDLNGDGFAELVIGAQAEDVGSVVDAGVVHILAGSLNGPTAAGSRYLSQAISGIADDLETWDYFGTAF